MSEEERAREGLAGSLASKTGWKKISSTSDAATSHQPTAPSVRSSVRRRQFCGVAISGGVYNIHRQTGEGEKRGEERLGC